MTPDLMPELRALLAHHSGLNLDPDIASSEENVLIDHLIEQTRSWELGDLDTNTLVALFDRHKKGFGSFSMTQWLLEKADAGFYDDPFSDPEE